MIGYKFETIERAEKAVADCAKDYGIPVAPDDAATKGYVDGALAGKQNTAALIAI